MICVYKITSPSGKIYIGSTINYARRVRSYKNLICSGQKKLYNSFVKYGFDTHSIEVLQECENKDELRKLEAVHGALNDCLGVNGLNLNLPKLSEEYECISESTRLKIRESQKGKTPWNKGKRWTSEALSISKKGQPSPMKGKKFSEERLKTHGKSRLGKFNKGRLVLNIYNGVFFDSVVLACDGTSYNHNTLRSVMNLKLDKNNKTPFVYA